jgi:spore germination cell wall hydrolase CwlJ-like protein
VPAFDALLLDRLPDHVRGAFGLTATMAILAAGISHFAAGNTSTYGWVTQALVRLPPAKAPPLLFRDVDRKEALSINASIPFSREPNPAARPFEIRGNDAMYNRALTCLTEAIYYEADGELPDGQRAVAQVVLNRVRHPAFSRSVCGAVYHGSMRTTGCQFSFTCDGSMRRRPTAWGWAKAREIAAQALAGAVFKPVGYATHYHADYVVPYWATGLAKNAIVGAHIFYRWPGWWGQPAAFASRHSGKETDPRLLRNATLRRHGVRPEPPAWSEADLVIEADPRVELLSIIQLLAARLPPDDDATPYEREVRSHFSAFSDHVAVEIYRQLTGGKSKFNFEASLQALMHYSQPPELESINPIERELVSAAGGTRTLAGFIAALRDFVKHSDFETFFEERRPFYDELVARVREPAFEFVNAFEEENGAPVHTVRFILAPLLAESGATGCQLVPKKAPGAWLIVGSGNAPEPFNKATQLEDALDKLSEGECLISPPATLASHQGRLISKRRAER